MIASGPLRAVRRGSLCGRRRVSCSLSIAREVTESVLLPRRDHSLRRHGGDLWTTFAIAIPFGALTGSVLLLILLVVFALAGHGVRSLPTVTAKPAELDGSGACCTREAQRRR